MHALTRSASLSSLTPAFCFTATDNLCVSYQQTNTALTVLHSDENLDDLEAQGQFHVFIFSHSHLIKQMTSLCNLPLQWCDFMAHAVHLELKRWEQARTNNLQHNPLHIQASLNEICDSSQHISLNDTRAMSEVSDFSLRPGSSTKPENKPWKTQDLHTLACSQTFPRPRANVRQEVHFCRIVSCLRDTSWPCDGEGLAESAFENTLARSSTHHQSSGTFRDGSALPVRWKQVPLLRSLKEESLLAKERERTKSRLWSEVNFYFAP